MKGTLICLFALCFGISTITGSYPVYHYNVRGRTLTSLEDVSSQTSGIYLRAKLVIQDRQNGLYSAYLEQAEYAQIHQNISNGIDSNIPDEKLQYVPYTLDPESQKFEFAYINGVIKQLRVEPNTPIYMINLIKSILSQFQVDLQGQNVVASHYNQKFNQNENTEHFKTMEDTVTGKCETLYDVLPVEEHVLRQYPEVAPYPHLGQILHVVKVKNYSQCNENMGYHFGLPQVQLKQIYGNNMGDFLAKSSVSNVYVSGLLNDFIVQSAVTNHKIVVSLLKYNNQKAVVVSRMNVTLASVRTTKEEVKSIKSPIVLPNLVYSYNNDFDTDNLMNLNEEYERLRRQRSVNNKVQWEHRGKDFDSSEESLESSYESDGCKKTEGTNKPTLSVNEPAENQFLPMNIGNQGQSIKNTVDVVRTVLDAISKITNELQNSQDLARSEILARYSIVIKLIRLLNVEELTKIDSHYAQQTEFSTKKQQQWKVFRDAVAQAGTGPALILIKRWVHSKRIYGEEAAQVISSLTNAAIYPTEEYIRIFYGISTSQDVQKQAILNDTAILSLTELVRMAYINNEESYARYPVKSFNIFGAHEIRHRFVIHELIPYLAQQLEQAIAQEDGHKVQVYIRALANIADIHVLKVFKPYLEGEKPMSEFHRLFVIVSMDQLAKLQPKAIRYVLHKFIMNRAESIQARVAAIYQIMQTKPSADMLQALAKLTHIEPSKEVRSAIKTALQSASKCREYWSEFARDARSALKMLKREEFAIQYSANYLYEYVAKHMSFGYKHYMKQIHSEDNLLPNYIYYSLYLNQGSYSRKYMNFGAMVSSIRSLTSAFQNQWKQWKHAEQQTPKETSQWAEKVARLLNITMNPQEKLQLNVLTNLFGAQRFYVFDQAIINQIPELLQNIMQQIRTGSNLNFTKFYNEDEVILSFPTEMSFPFVYTFQKPSVFHLQGKVALKKTDQWELSHQFKFVAATKVQAKAGFVTPHDNQVYVTGYDKDIIVNLPFDVRVGLNVAKPYVQLQIAPRDQKHNETMVHYSTKPYTAHYSVLNLQPARFEENSTLIHFANHQQIEKLFGQEHGIAFSARMTSEQLTDYHMWKQLFEKYGQLAPIMAILFESNLEHTEFELKHIPQLSKARFVNIGVEYMSKKRYEQEINGNVETTPTEWSDLSTTEMPLSENESNKPQHWRIHQKKVVRWEMHEETETELLSRANIPWEQNTQLVPKYHSAKKYLIRLLKRALIDSDKHASGDAIAITMELVGQKPVKYVVGLACSISKSYQAGRQIMHAYRVTENVDQQYAVDVEIDSQATQPSTWNYLEALHQDSRLESNIQMKYGLKNTKPAKINMNVTWYKSDERRHALNKSPLVRVCQQQMQQNIYKHPACANLTAEASRIDRVYVQVDYDQVGSYAKNWSMKALNTLHHFGYDYLDENTVNATGTGSQQRIQMWAQFNPENYKTVNVVIKSPQRETHFNNVRVNQYIKPLVALRPGVLPVADLKAKLMNRIESKPICAFERDSVTTFNNRSYPVTLGDCYHVLLHADSQQPHDNIYTVLVRESVDGQWKKVKIIYGRKHAQKEIELVPSSNDPKRPVVHFNGQKIQQTTSQSVYQHHSEHSYVRMFQLNTPEFKIQINDDLIVHYNPAHVQVQLSDNYYGVSRGLCGANNGEPAYDFIAPRNCLMWDHRNFSASYAVVDETCQGQAREQYHKSLKAVCTPRTIKHHKIVGEGLEMETSSPKTACTTKLRTHYVVQDDKVCFTVQQVPVCSKGCKTKKNHERTVDLHCLKQSQVTDLYRKQIDKGANPSFADKKVSKTIKIKVPATCVAK